MSDTLRASFRIVTPMFLGGADQNKPELRPPAIKGALRFWWRALQWGPCLAETAGNERAALCRLHKREGKIFGTASGDHGGRQSTFRLRARPEGDPTIDKPAKSWTGQSYLAGPGLYKFGKGYTRKAIREGPCFQLLLDFNRSTEDAVRKQVEESLVVFGLLGGLGARARRGFGSVALDSLQGSDLEVPRDVESLKELLSELLHGRAQGLPPFTAFSRKSRIDCSLQGHDAAGLLNDVGIEMVKYRSYGRNGLIGQKGDPTFPPRRAERNFEADHAAGLAVAQGNIPDKLPKRIAFGLPHNYYFASGAKSFFEPEARDRKERRRASPLLIHIHRFRDNDHVAIQTFLPASFLPEGIDIRMKAPGKRPSARSFRPCWQVIHRYLDRFPDRKELLR